MKRKIALLVGGELLRDAKAVEVGEVDVEQDRSGP